MTNNTIRDNGVSAKVNGTAVAPYLLKNTFSSKRVTVGGTAPSLYHSSKNLSKVGIAKSETSVLFRKKNLAERKESINFALKLTHKGRAGSIGILIKLHYETGLTSLANGGPLTGTRAGKLQSRWITKAEGTQTYC